MNSGKHSRDIRKLEQNAEKRHQRLNGLLRPCGRWLAVGGARIFFWVGGGSWTSDSESESSISLSRVNELSISLSVAFGAETPTVFAALVADSESKRTFLF